MIRRPSRNETVRGLFHPVAVEFSVQRGDADAQQAGGLGLVAFRVFEYPEDVVPFEGVERHRVGHGAVARRGMEFGGEAADGEGAMRIIG